jgi:hypothetical protein
LLLPACAGSETRAPEVVVQDSMGIQVVTVPAAVVDALPVWRIAAEPSLSIGEVDGEAPYLFGGISDRGVTVLADSTISIVDAGPGTREIRLFDRSGRFLRSMGRIGQGPGEFGSIPHTHPHPSGVLAYDGNLRRITVFSHDGELVESWPTSAECPWGEQCQTVSALADGTAVVRFRDRVEFLGAPVGARYDSVLVHIGLAERERFTDLGTFVAPPLTVTRSVGADVTGAPAPLLSLSWDRRVLTGREHVIVQDPDRGELLIFDRTGLRRIVRLEHTPLALSAEQTNAVREEGGARFENQAVLSSWPVFGDVRVGEGDDLWVGDYRHELITPPDTPRRYTLVGVDGRPVARVEIRPDPLVGDRRFSTLARSTRDELRVVTSDALDVSRVLFFAIEKDRP